MHWLKVPLSEVLRLASVPVRVDPEASYPNIGLYSYARGPFTKPPITGAETSATTLFRVRAGQFIYSRLFAFEGAYALVPPEMDGACVSNEYPVFDIDEAQILPGYLGWYFKQPTVWQTITVGSKGMGNRRQRVHPDQVLRYAIPLPPPEDQHRIVARLDRAAALIQARRAAVAEIEANISALIEHLHFRLSDDQPRQFGEFVELWEDKVEIEREGRYPQIGLRGFAGGIFFKDAVLGKDTSYRNFHRLTSDLLVVSQPKGWEGAVAVCGTEHVGWFASPEYRTFRCKEDVLRPTYLRHLIKTPWVQSELAKLTRGQGARRERLRPEMLLGMSIQMPNVAAQANALRVIEMTEELRSISAASTADIDALLPALLNETFAERAAAA